MRPREPILATHIITRLIVGGAQENTIATVLGIAGQPGFRCNLISGPTAGPEGSLESDLLARGGELFRVPSLIRPVHPWLDIRALVEVRRAIRRLKPDLVHTHSGKAGILGRWAAYLEKVPIIVHGIHGPSFGSWQGRAANLAFTAAERLAGRKTTHFVAVAQAMIDQYLAAGIGSPEKYTRIYSGFELTPYLHAVNDPALRAQWKLGPGDLVIGKIARITPLKGHDDLLAVAPELARRFPRLRFLLVGGGSLENSLRSRVAAAGLADRFVFTGLVPPRDIPRLTGIMDILVHLSLREGLPRALPQALAAGKPVIAYNCDGAAEVCLSGETGFLVTAGDRDALLDRLTTLAADPALRKKLGEQGRAFVGPRFSTSAMVEATHRLYLQLLEARGVGP